MQIDVMPANDSRWGPDETGRFGEFGGRYVPETLEVAYRGLHTDDDDLKGYHAEAKKLLSIVDPNEPPPPALPTTKEN